MGYKRSFGGYGARSGRPFGSSIPGFRIKPFGPYPRGDYGKILTNRSEPGFSTHVHKHPDGITLSTYHPDGSKRRFNLTTGREERGRGPRR